MIVLALAYVAVLIAGTLIALAGSMKSPPVNEEEMERARMRALSWPSEEHASESSSVRLTGPVA